MIKIVIAELEMVKKSRQNQSGLNNYLVYCRNFVVFCVQNERLLE